MRRRRPRRRRRDRAVRRRDAGRPARGRLRAVRRLPRDSQQRGPLIVVGAGLPHLPAVLSAHKSLLGAPVPLCAHRPAGARGGRPRAGRAGPRRGRGVRAGRARALYALTDGYPYFVQAYGKVAWDLAPASPVTAADVRWPRPRPRRSWRSASSARGTSGRRRPSGTTCGRWPPCWTTARRGATTEVADDRAAQAVLLSPARDALLKKGLVYSAERGTIAFTVPHFGRYLRKHATV